MRQRHEERGGGWGRGDFLVSCALRTPKELKRNKYRRAFLIALSDSRGRGGWTTDISNAERFFFSFLVVASNPQACEQTRLKAQTEHADPRAEPSETAVALRVPVRLYVGPSYSGEVTSRKDDAV